MKKLLLILTALSVMTLGLAAQDTTWTNPLSEKTDTVPHSMLNAVTNGTMYDGIDVIITSPAELSEFPGFSFYTAYGNYESWANLPKDDTIGPVSTIINPFTTTGLGGIFNGASTADGNVAFQLGYMMPIAGMQSGIVGGFQLGKRGNLNVGDDGNITLEETVVSDADANNVAEFTTSESADITSFVVGNYFRIGAGVDLGFMGVSLAFNAQDASTLQGGVYDYSWTVGEVVPVASTTTSKSIKYGMNSDGKPALSQLDDDWDIEATGQLPLEIAGFSMPLTASLRFGMVHGIAPAPANGIPLTVDVRTAYDNTTGAGTVDDVSTLNYTIGLATFNETVANGEMFGGGSIDVATLGTATGLIGSTLARSEDQRHGNITFGISAGMDPKFVISDILQARTRAKINFDFTSIKTNDNGYMDISLSQAETGFDNSTWSYSTSVEDPNETTQVELEFELGGILEATSPSGRLTLSSGIFYNPVFDLQTTANNPTVTTTTYSATDSTGTVPEITAASLFGDADLTTAVGTQTSVTTQTFSGPTKTNTINHSFIVPVTARV
ncbi:MAG: hypothetical protein JEY91_15145, partial [Spirochaetaceae bacterium]|nr:hypothetical protein [Spirochaetaceae bacterium]